jgi:hypothetical protein
LPSTDLVASDMLAERVAGSETQVKVVNPSAGPVVERLELLGVQRDSISVIDGGAAVEHFVDMIEAETCLSTAHSLVAQPGNPQLGVAIDDARMSAVTDIDFRDSMVRLILTEPFSDLNHATRLRSGTDSRPIDLEKLRSILLASSSNKLVAVLHGSVVCPIIDHQTPVAMVPSALGAWLVLVASAAPTGGADGEPVGAAR